MKGFAPRTGAPSLERVKGEGDEKDVDVMAHVQAIQGINVWAGTGLDGTPIPVDHGGWLPGQSRRKEGVVVPHDTYPHPSKS